jgi:dienelactone hydrolase
MRSVIETNIAFPSEQGSCAGSLFRPDSPNSFLPLRPIVVLGHGLGAVRQMRLPDYARRFAQAGYLAVTFDYRHFGDSDGEPRQVLSIRRQQEDWQAAVRYARSVPGADERQVAVFGTSFGGGHVIELAAKDHSLAAVIAQCPFTIGLASLAKVRPPGSIKVAARAAADLLAAARRKPPVLVPLVGPTGAAALMNAPDALDGYLGIVPEGLVFTNEVSARTGAAIPLWAPGRLASKVTAPILFAICERDTVAPAGPTLRFARQAPNATIHRYPFGHFEIYSGSAFHKAVEDYVGFLQTHVPAPDLER